MSERFIDHILRFITTHYRPQRALDLGAGELWQSEQMGEEGIVVDAVEPQLKTRRKAPKNVTLHAMTAQEFGYPEETYDLVVCRMMLQRLSGDDAFHLLIEQIYSTLKPNGILYLMVPDRLTLPQRALYDYDEQGHLRFDVPESDYERITTYVFRK